MENLRIFSMNLRRGFIPVKDKRKKEFLREKLEEEKYDIIMLQGYNIINGLDLSRLNYSYTNSFNNTITLSRDGLPIFEDSFSLVVNSSIVFNGNSPLAVINVNCNNSKSFDEVSAACELYTKEENAHYVRSRIVAGRFPKDVDTNNFCDMFDLEDISTLVGQDTHLKNNKDMVNHFFVSRNLEAVSIHKLVGLTETLKLGEAYPIEASISYKKVLK